MIHPRQSLHPHPRAQRQTLPGDVVGTLVTPRRDGAASAPGSFASPSGWEPSYTERIEDAVLCACVLLLVVGFCAMLGGAA